MNEYIQIVLNDAKDCQGIVYSDLNHFKFSWLSFQQILLFACMCRCFTRIRGIIHMEGEAALSDVYSWRRRELGHEFPMWTFIKTDRHIRTERSHLKNKRLSSRHQMWYLPPSILSINNMRNLSLADTL